MRTRTCRHSSQQGPNLKRSRSIALERPTNARSFISWNDPCIVFVVSSAGLAKNRRVLLRLAKDRFIFNNILI
jgi:hypothetical protein